ncbi:MAG: hypothetical protein IKP45_08125 [Bacteroidales bacterium]|nr:hypothetical protein [Bacteroidales bacterium]
MKNRIRIITVVALLMLSCFATAQQASTLYYMDRVFQSQTVNVSEIPSNKIQVGGLIVPIFGQLPPAFYFNYGNNSFHYNHILHFGKGDMKDSLVLDMPLLMKKVRKNVSIRNELRVDYLNFSLKTKSNAVVTVSLADRFMFGTTIPRNFFDFVLHGNRDYMLEGKSHDISKLSLSATAFRELGIGFSMEILEKWSVGARMKLLFGMADVSTDIASLQLSTDPDMYFITADADMQIRKSTGMLAYDIMDSSFNFSGADNLKGDLLNFGNVGVGIDLGMSYKITDKIGVSFSATDIGFINWLQNSQVASARGEYTFEGVEMGFKQNDEGKLSYGIDTARYNIGHIVDTMVYLFDMDIHNRGYMTWLPANIYIGATYQYHEKLGFGFLYRGEFYHKTYNQSFTLSVNSNLTHWLSLHGSWSFNNNTALNLGLGFSARLGFITWFMVTDDVIGLVFPQKAKTVNMRMGCNLTFGHPKKKSRTAAKL